MERAVGGLNGVLDRLESGAAYELATGTSLAPADFEGGKTGAVKVLGKLGFTVEKRSGT
ncbi:hypothetical protein [Kribbella capetownensis]|uniref:hypothetical protein n=1 Tax=Kribbella capetownensis TaxID=1572659 RepID=UPI0013F3F0C0|nr:hypothetical protein [Kribbella capetownensis]